MITPYRKLSQPPGPGPDPKNAAYFDYPPLENFKVLYGTGALKLNGRNEVRRVGGISYTIKDGIVYDAKRLLADVGKMVRGAKAKDNYQFAQPGMGDKSVKK